MNELKTSLQNQKTRVTSPSPLIEIKDLKKSFGQNHVLNGFSLNLYERENIVILGKSGSGKSVLLKCIVRLLEHDSGLLKILGKEVKNLRQEDLDKLRTDVGFLFQGSVSHISILNDTTLRVKMLIEQNVQKNMKKSAIASIGTDGLVGGTLVNIEPRGRSNQAIEDEDILKTESNAELGGMLNTLDGTNDNIASITLKLLEITEKVNEGQGMIASLLNDASLRDDVGESVNSIKKTGENLELLSREFNQMFNEVKEGKGMLGYMLTDNTLVNQVEGTVSQLDDMVGGDLKSTFSNLKKSSEDINAFTAELKNSIQDIKIISSDLKEITSNINDGEGAIGVLLNDEELGQGIISNINKSAIKLDENLEALKQSWPFRRYYRKKRKEARKKSNS